MDDLTLDIGAPRHSAATATTGTNGSDSDETAPPSSRGRRRRAAAAAAGAPHPGAPDRDDYAGAAAAAAAAVGGLGDAPDSRASADRPVERVWDRTLGWVPAAGSFTGGGDRAAPPSPNPLRRGGSATAGGALARGASAALVRKLTGSRGPAEAGDWAALELARAESEQRRAEVRLPLGEPDEGDYGKGAKAGKAGKADSPEVAAEKAEAKAAKEEKELKKKIKDFMKTSLSSERTFFKWVWAGLNLGALGTFALVFFHDEGFPFRLIVVLVAWSMALLSALYGLRQFHRRRRALLSVVDDPDTWESPHAPAIVVAAFVIMMLTLVVYAIASGQQFGFRSTDALRGSAADQG